MSDVLKRRLDGTFLPRQREANPAESGSNSSAHDTPSPPTALLNIDDEMERTARRAVELASRTKADLISTYLEMERKYLALRKPEAVLTKDEVEKQVQALRENMRTAIKSQLKVCHCFRPAHSPHISIMVS